MYFKCKNVILNGECENVLNISLEAEAARGWHLHKLVEIEKKIKSSHHHPLLHCGVIKWSRFIRLWKKRHWISLLRKCGQFVETRPFCAECRLATDSHFKVPSRFLYIQFLSKHHSNTGNSWLIWMFLFFKALSTEMVRRFNVSVICFIIFFQDFIYLPGSIAIWVKSGADPHPLPFIRSAPLSLLLLFTRLFFISHINGFNKEKTLWV